MKEILSWNEKKDNFYDYKKSKNVLKFYGDYNKFKYLIDKTESQYCSETQENYRPFHYKGVHENLK